MARLDRFQLADKDRNRLLRRYGFKMKFPGQHEQEQSVLTLRRHIASFLFEIIILFGAVLIPAIAYSLIASFGPNLLQPPFRHVLVLLLSLYVFFIALYAFLVWIDRYFDVWVITNKRLIDVEQKSFFNRVTAELELDKIQDVRVSVKGFLPTMFRYGNIEVQTAAAHRNFEIQDIKLPHVVKDVLMESARLYTREREEQRAEQAAQASATIAHRSSTNAPAHQTPHNSSVHSTAVPTPSSSASSSSRKQPTAEDAPSTPPSSANPAPQRVAPTTSTPEDSSLKNAPSAATPTTHTQTESTTPPPNHS